MTAQEDLRATEDRLADRMDAGFGRITKRLDTLNGAVADHTAQLGIHSTDLAVAKEKMDAACLRLNKGEEERGVLFKLVRSMDKAGARQSAYVAGAVAAVVLLLELVVVPLFSHFTGG